jgi:hypothetical protein
VCTVVGEEVGSKRRGMCVGLLSWLRLQVELRRLSWGVKVGGSVVERDLSALVTGSL